ncbi:MAG: MCE family protein [Prevotellaceae bacterium]|nr:MCE family protein [Prevotellaceae bacterium]
MRFLTKEVKIALTAIVAVVLLFIGINFLKGINIFKSSNTYYVEFSNIDGLAVSNAVYANGYPVGIVRAIDYDYSRTDKVVVTVELDKKMRVPRGTHAELASQLMGGVNMSLVLGPNPADILEPGATLSGRPAEGMMTKLEDALPEVLAMLPKIDSIMTNLSRLTADPAIAEMLRNTAGLTASLSRSAAGLETLMSHEVKPMLASLGHTAAHAEKLMGGLAATDVEATMASLQQTLHNAEIVTDNLGRTAASLNGKLESRDNSLGLLLNDRQLYDGLNGTVASADSLLTDIKARPKRYVHFSVFGKKDK